MKNQIQIKPRKGEVILIKEDKILLDMWKLGKIEKINGGKDNNVRSVTVHLSNKRCVQRAINQLYPLEITRYLQTNEEDIQVSDRVGEHLQNAGHERPIRKAAITARKRINELLKINALSLLFN